MDSVDDLGKILAQWKYSDGRPWTASEIEMYVAHRRHFTYRLIHGENAPASQLPDNTDHKWVKRDFLGCMLEVAPDPADEHGDWKSAEQVRFGLHEAYRQLALVADLTSGRLVPIADYGCTGLKIENPLYLGNSRYRYLAKIGIPGARIGATRTGFQTHIMNWRPLDDTYFVQRRIIEQFTPLLLALSANSWHPDTDVHSSRYFHFKTIRSCGPRSWLNREHYVRELSEWFEDGALRGPHDGHPWIKPCVGSTEVRICDTPGAVDEAIYLHALSHMLIEYVKSMGPSYQDVYLMDRYESCGRIELALDLAACNGLSSLDYEIANPYQEGKTPIGVLFTQFFHDLEPIAQELGYQAELSAARRAVEQQNNGATRAQQWFNNSRWPVRQQKQRVMVEQANLFLKSSIDERVSAQAEAA